MKAGGPSDPRGLSGSGLLGRTFRSGRRHELVVFDRLAPAEQEGLRRLAADGSFYGILRPLPGIAGSPRAVDRTLALLLFTLERPGPLPTFLRDDLGPDEELRRRVAALVLDGVLEVETEEGFVTGIAAQPWLGGSETGEEAVEGTLARLSQAALRHAAALDLDDPEKLARRLYAYHRLPLTPRRARQFPGRDRVCRELGLDERCHARSWRRSPGAETDRWIFWHRRGRAKADPDRPTFKLYVSPALDALGEVTRALFPAVSAGRAFQVKLGADAAGLLRPDKLVIYFAELDQLAATADRLLTDLGGVPAHGVPFSAEIGGEGLLSWGLDPPASALLVSWRPRPSWRAWVTDRLATTLADGRRQGAGGQAWRFALDRLRLEGVDTATWHPRETHWGESGGGA